jgi:hypothetical protein
MGVRKARRFIFYRNDTREHCGVILHLQERRWMKGVANWGWERDEISFAVGCWFVLRFCIGITRRVWRVKGWEWNGMGCLRVFFLIRRLSVDRNRTMYEHIERLIF